MCQTPKLPNSQTPKLPNWHPARVCPLLLYLAAVVNAPHPLCLSCLPALRPSCQPAPPLRSPIVHRSALLAYRPAGVLCHRPAPLLCALHTSIYIMYACVRVCACMCVCDALRNLPMFYRVACNPFIYGLSYFPLTIVNRIFGRFLALGDFWRLSCRLLPDLLMPLQAPACSSRLQMGARAHLGANISISHKTNSVLRHQRKLYIPRKFCEVAHCHFSTLAHWHIVSS